MKKINVAIDGPSGAGKSTVSKEVAKKLGYTFINTGSVYRAIALNCVNRNINYKNEEDTIKSLREQMIELREDEHIFLDNEDVSSKIRDDIISYSASFVAQYPKVREYVVRYIQTLTKNHKGYIMDGRDTTFKVMPHAEVKIFLSATPEARALRRIKQNKEMGYEEDYDKVLKEVLERDYKDTHRKSDPLHKTKDAIEINCTNMTFEEVVDKIIELINKELKNEK